jgi:hypothetical protein
MDKHLLLKLLTKNSQTLNATIEHKELNKQIHIMLKLKKKGTNIECLYCNQKLNKHLILKLKKKTLHA